MIQSATSTTAGCTRLLYNTSSFARLFSLTGGVFDALLTVIV
jgi:hypothetical protein